MLCGSLVERGVSERKGTCICMAEPLCCVSETITILLICSSGHLMFSFSTVPWTLLLGILWWIFFLSGHLNVSHSPELSLLSELAHMNSFSFSFCCILILLTSLSLSHTVSFQVKTSRVCSFQIFEKITAFWDFIFSVSHQIRTLPLIQNYKSMSHIPYLKSFHYL